MLDDSSKGQDCKNMQVQYIFITLGFWFRKIPRVQLLSDV